MLTIIERLNRDFAQTTNNAHAYALCFDMHYKELDRVYQRGALAWLQQQYPNVFYAWLQLF
jgi:hypothetical protein